VLHDMESKQEAYAKAVALARRKEEEKDSEKEEVGSGHSMMDTAVEAADTSVRGWGKAGSLVEETRALQEKGWERRSIRPGHYEYVSPDRETFTNMADALKYGKDDERKGGEEEAASAGGGSSEEALHKRERNKEREKIRSLKHVSQCSHISVY
jgi:hypothetical protein